MKINGAFGSWLSEVGKSLLVSTNSADHHLNRQFQGLGFQGWWGDPAKIQASRKMCGETCGEMNAIAELFKDYRASWFLSWSYHIGQFMIPSLHRTILLHDGYKHFLNLIFAFVAPCWAVCSCLLWFNTPATDLYECMTHLYLPV